MRKTLARFLAVGLSVMLPVAAFAASDLNVNDYNVNSGDYNYNSDSNFDYGSVSNLNENSNLSTVDDLAGSTALAGFGMILLAVWGVSMLIGLVSLIFTIMMIVDAAHRTFDNKTMWIVLLLFFGFFSSIPYYFVVKKKNVGAVAKPAAPVTPATPTTPAV